MKLKEVCPRCYSTTGFSIVMEDENNGVFTCSKNSQHRYKKSKDGFLEPYSP